MLARSSHPAEDSPKDALLPSIEPENVHLLVEAIAAYLCRLMVLCQYARRLRWQFSLSFQPSLIFIDRGERIVAGVVSRTRPMDIVSSLRA